MSDSSSQDSTPSPDASVALDRRGFLTRMMGCAVSAGTLLTCTAGMFRFLKPNVRYEPSPRIFLDHPEEYTLGTTFLEEARIYLIRNEEGFRALSAICTHLGCTVGATASGKEYRCPCHGSRFDSNGQVLKGPAPEALPWLAVMFSADGRLMVDRSRPVPATQVLRV